MIPVISTVSYNTSFESKQGRRSEPLIAYCTGGSALGVNDSTAFQWEAVIVDNEIRVRLEGSDTYTVAVSGEGLEFVSLAFDTAMNYAIAYVQSGVGKLLYYTGSEYTTLELGAVKPFVALDIIAQVLYADADLIVSYVRNNDLYARVQRESFGTERLLKEDAGREIVRFGRNSGNRLQWQLLPIIN